MQAEQRHIEGETCAACGKPVAGEFIQISVEDSGQGMDEATAGHIFDAYFTTKEEGKGTGIGLFTVQGIVHGNGGHITLDTKPGYGTRMRVLIPVKDGLQGSAEQASLEDELAVLSNRHLVVVDDELAVASYMQEMFRLHGANVRAFTSGNDALAYCQVNTTPVDLLITDLQMPGMSGIELTRELRDQGFKMAVLVCTGYEDILSREQMKSLNIFGELQKPIERQQMLAIIQRIFEQTEETIG
ncbi:MAG: response regulator [Gammaproteobacteria bacterium]|nr:response regulator [Gammaproteobacteria bacterium]